MNLAQNTVKLIRTGSRIYLSAAGLQTLHISILLTGAEYPYFDCSRHITTGSVAAKIHMQSMQIPNQNSMALCCRVIWLFETVDRTHMKAIRGAILKQLGVKIFV
jgi:hypothetical protein